MTRTAAVAILLVLLSGVAWAEGEEKSLETRWHEAYVLEVIEGKVPEAARVYLDLIEEPELPKHLMRECRFRFAVCAALLGRTDEARSVLAGLATDEAAPEEFKARVTEYFEKLANAGVGSALDKRLEALVYELGRAMTYEASALVYRDFQLIGTPAVPTLVKLLEHRDALLRTHAYCILCRMDEPIVVTMLPVAGGTGWSDLRKYLVRNPGMAGRVEPRLLDLVSRLEPAEFYKHVCDTGLWRLPIWGMPFVDALAAHEGYEGLVANLLEDQKWTDETRKTVSRWIRQGREELAYEASRAWLRRLSKHADEKSVDTFLSVDLFPTIVVRLRRHVDGAVTGPLLSKYARAMPAELVLDVLGETAKNSENGRLPSTWSHVFRGLEPLEDRVDAAALERVVRLGMEMGQMPSGPTVRFLFTHLPLDEGRALVRDVMKPIGGQMPKSLFAYETERDVELFLAALGNMPESWRSSQVGNCLATCVKQQEVPDAVRHALARALPRIWRLLLGYERRSTEFTYSIGALCRGLPDEEVRGILVDLAAVVPDFSENWRRQAVTSLLNVRQTEMTMEEKVRFNREIRGRALGGIARASGALESVVHCAVGQMFSKQIADWNLGPGGHDAILEFLAENLAVVVRAGNTGVTVLIDNPDHFPLIDWVPLTSNTCRQRVGVQRADAVADALTANPVKVNSAVLSFLRATASEMVQTRVFDRMLSLDDATFVGLVLAHTNENGSPASPAALEKALKTLTADENTPLALVSQLVRRLARKSPSPGLFPYVERLVDSEERLRVLEGIQLAQSLCSKKLVPALIARLDSLDSGIREAARKAIDAIFEIDRIKEEARKRLGEK